MLNASTDSWIANKEVAWNVPRCNVDRNLAYLNPAELPLQGAGMAPCRYEDLCFFGSGEFRGVQKCQGNNDEAF